MKFYLMAVMIAMFTVVSCQEDDSIDRTNPLTAVAGEDQQVALGETILLDGSESEDEEEEEFSYQWNMKSKPSGSQATITNSTTVTPEFVADKVGNYVIELVIRKGNWVSKDEVQIVVSEVVGTETVIISEDILTDMVMEDVFPEDWTKIDYLITKPIKLQAKLTIKPGVKVIFSENAALTVTASGAFITEGGDQEQSRIYLTSEAETPGNWVGIYFQSNNPINKIINTSLEYAGGDNALFSSNSGLWMDSNSQISIENSYFTNNKGTAIYLSPEASLISFKGNVITGLEGEEHVLALPAPQVEKIAYNNQFFNGDIAVTTTYLDSGNEITWESNFYTLLEGLKIINGTGLNLMAYTEISIEQDKQIAILNGGYLNAIGLHGNPVKFHGTDQLEAGYWKGIFIEHSNDNPSVFEYVSVRNAGSSPLAGNQPASIHIGAYGLALMDNSSIGLGAGDGIEATSEGATILSFNENYIRYHDGYAMAVSTKNVAVIDYYTRFNFNGFNKVRVDGNYPIANDEETVWKGFYQPDVTYHVKGLGKDLVVWSGLKLEPGVKIEMENEARIVVESANGREGYLYGKGTTTDHVIFRNINGLVGSWYGITFSNTSQNNYLEFAEILHGGKTVDNSFSANITVDNSPEGKLTIVNSTVGYSGQHGISVLNEKRSNLNDINVTYVGIPEDTVYAW
ncbi:right-handed parallel beta-helix repeat-containing protein [Gaetbulibacter sp. M235]|uniref:PKD domain-containing protein n=1 Tax=Gaetbulibacter sp. M235 TaxID=3126510 RepID=UPI00374F4B04